MKLTPIVQMLVDANLGEEGKTILINHLPADIKKAVLIRPRLIGAKLDPNLPGYLKFDVQVIVRGETYVETQSRAFAVAKALTVKGEKTVGTWKINYMRPHAVPVGYPLTLGGLIEFNMDIAVCCVDSEWV